MIKLLKKLLLFALLSAPAFGQLWSGVLSTSHGTDWTKAGVQGGIPSAAWAQCGSTIAAYTGTGQAITDAIAACGVNQYVHLGTGTFHLSTGITWTKAGVAKSNTVLRGDGANATFLIFSSGASITCPLEASLICVSSVDGTYFSSNTSYSWTAGYSQNSTTVTLASSVGISPGVVLVLNQCDTGFSGTTLCPTGSSVDNGNYFNASEACVLNGGSTACTTGASNSGPNSGNGSARRFQTEFHTVVSCSPSCNTAGSTVVTMGEGLIHPNFNTSQSPQAWFFTPITNVGVENLSIDGSATTTAATGISSQSSLNYWIKGVRIVWANKDSVRWIQGVHFTLQDSYIFEAQFVDSHAWQMIATGFGLIQNNIVQQHRDAGLAESDDTGTVIAYNTVMGNCNYLSGSNSCQSDNLQASYRTHSNGDDFELYEGNVGTYYSSDSDHGTHLSQTFFRNFFTGWESCAFAGTNCGAFTNKDFLTNAYVAYGYVGRYHNVVGNVFGTPGFHTNYQLSGGVPDLHSVYGIAGPKSGATPPFDTLVLSTTLRWGNYDVVRATNSFCASGHTGFVATCGSVSEVPSGIAVFPNAVPTQGDTVGGQSVMPSSFYLSSKPAWFGSHTWPPIGPDVTSGDVGQCNGTLNVANRYNGLAVTASGTGCTKVSGWNGQVFATPSFDCYLNTMGGKPDGNAAVALPFDPAVCYAAGPATVATPTFSPVAGTYGSTQSVTISTATGGATLCYTIDGSTPTANGGGTCTHGTTYSTAVSVSSSLTLKAVGSLSGDSDSSVGSAAYTITPPTVATPTFSPVAGTYVGTQSVTISTSTGGATKCYTIDGTTPTANGAGTCTHGTTYSTPVSVGSSLTLKAVGSLSGSSDSSVGSAAYTITPPTVATPTFSPVAGTYSSTQSVTISTITGGATLCYTIDGTSPTANGAGVCTHGSTYSSPVSVASSLTLKAIGSFSGDSDSAVGSAAYVISGPAATPTFSPVAGTYSGGKLIIISSATSGSTLCYTTDGSTPTADGAGTCTHGTTYTAPFGIFANTTIKAVASKSGNTDSSVGTAAYVITYPVNVMVTGGGRVTDNTAVISCPGTCSATYISGTSVTLAATPNAGNTFSGWTGSCSGTSPCVLSITSIKNTTATFAAVPSIHNGTVGTGASVSGGAVIR